MLVVGASVLFVGLNICVDIYGIFGFGSPQKPIYTNERTAKYLMAANYIPQHFDGIVLGPSLSANMQVENFDVAKFYNASVMGANITELKLIAENILNTKAPKYAIICLDPYMVKDAGKKTSMIDEREFWGALGSTFLIKTYVLALVRELELLPSKFPKDVIQHNGFNDFNKEYNWQNPAEHIARKLATNDPIVYPIDTQAYTDLTELLTALRAANTQVIAYFSPVPAPLMQRHQQAYANFQKAILKPFLPEDIIVNFNAPGYNAFTQNLDNYIDHGHLSAQGQHFIVSELNTILAQHSAYACD